MDEEDCEPIIKHDNGTYETMDGRWRLDKILQGNAYHF